jgi:hypothetical protein
MAVFLTMASEMMAALALAGMAATKNEVDQLPMEEGREQESSLPLALSQKLSFAVPPPSHSRAFSRQRERR